MYHILITRSRIISDARNAPFISCLCNTSVGILEQTGFRWSGNQVIIGSCRGNPCSRPPYHSEPWMSQHGTLSIWGLTRVFSSGLRLQSHSRLLVPSRATFVSLASRALIDSYIVSDSGSTLLRWLLAVRLDYGLFDSRIQKCQLCGRNTMAATRRRHWWNWLQAALQERKAHLQ